MGELEKDLASGAVTAPAGGSTHPRDIIAHVAKRTYVPIPPATDKEASPMIDWSVRYVSNNFASPIFLDDVARATGISKFHFIRKFRQETGLTPGAFIKRYRLVQAMEILAKTNAPIHEVAKAVGYKDAAAFSRAFLKETGTKPHLYRQSHKQTTTPAADQPAQS